VTTNDDEGRASYVLAAAQATRFLAAFHARNDDEVQHYLTVLRADPRGFELTLGAMAELFLGALEKLDAQGALTCSVQSWVDQLALSCGAEADAIVAKYRRGGEQDGGQGATASDH
jgi:hypothetical protein